MNHPTERAEYAAGLRKLADHLDAHTCTPLPIDGRLTPLPIQFTGPGGDELMAETAALLGGDWEPTFTQGSHGILYGLDGYLDGLRVRLIRYLEAPAGQDGSDEDEPAEDAPVRELAGAA